MASFATSHNASFDAGSSALQELYISALVNAHALENEAIQLIHRQLDRLEHYPEIEQVLRQHLDETHAQQERLKELLEAKGESPSTFKDTAMSIMGNLAALAHTPASDEVLKNHFANHAFENFEIAAYTSLIAMADTIGEPSAVSALQQSLKEEEKTAAWLKDNTKPITLKYMSLLEQGEKADR